jgi:hypothetical protein
LKINHLATRGANFTSITVLGIDAICPTLFTPKNGAQLNVNQGDQIGRIFAHWAIVYFGQIFETLKSSPYFLATSFHC